ncbi:hypothetical protein RBH26_11595 [Natronolimnohabitans sp. A-GB9]|uniref:DUF7289 family protein n=1 Tax=Natronolimnohabitans sp. A-GB9 TaxID=3069757 RepID=UPI0027B6220E|nr:hypothetical protein [Natronolimnohabitans sp. A-GB9]MDQ2051125.1 hypothetical protein [Natronolimnohabitans sp. A-GB9]
MKSWERPEERGGDSEDRAAAPILGLVLLFAMVILGAMLVFVAAGPLFDALQSESERERAVTYMSQTDQSLATATISDDPQPLEVPPDADLSVVEDGELEVAWYNDSENPSETRSGDSVTLGALEYELDDRTIAHQGGAIWEQTDSGVRIESPPETGFDSDGTLELDLMQITSGTDEKSSTQIRNNPETAMEAAEDLEQVKENPTGDHLALRIESTYAEGWAQHFSDEKADVDEWDITVDGPTELGEDAVVVKINGFGDPQSQPYFLVEDDNGLTPHSEGEPHTITDNVVEDGTDFHINTTLRNDGDSEETVTATLSIRDESGDLIEEREITSKAAIESGEKIRTDDQSEWEGGNHFFRTGNGGNTIGVEPGNEYQYDVKTDPGGDTLDEQGTFIVVDDEPTFTIDDIEFNDPVKPGEPLTADVEITNEGSVTDQQFVGLEGFDGEVVDIEAVELDDGETGTTELQWGAVEEPGLNDQVTITTETDSSTTDADNLIEYIELVDLDVEEPIKQGQTVDIEADVLRASGDSDDYVARLVDSDGDEIQTIEYGNNDWRGGTVDFEYETDDDEITHRVTAEVYDEANDVVDDEMETVVVLERDGPVCSEINYEGSGTSDDPYQVSTVDELQCIDDHDLEAHYELVDNIDAHGTEFWSDGAGFEPIGQDGNEYANSDVDDGTSSGSFKGTFDGNGHLIDGLYIDRPDERFVGLFGATGHTTNVDPIGSGSTIENVRLADVDVHGRQHVGALVGQAGGEVIQSRSEGRVEAEEQLVGGLIGDGVHASLDNELVAEGTVIGGPNRDGMNGEGIGGLVGRSTFQTEVSVGYTQNMTVIADGEKYNGYGFSSPPDRSHAGGLIGTSSYRDSTFEQMYTITSAEGFDDATGAVVGTVLGSWRESTQGDTFAESVYWRNTEEPYGVNDVDWGAPDPTLDWNGRSKDEMTGIDVNQDGRMGNLKFEEEGGPWIAIPDDYPRFTWELEAEGIFEVEIDDVEENVTAGEDATVSATITSRYQDRIESTETQQITLTADNRTVDTKEVTLESLLEEDDDEQITLEWDTSIDDAGTSELTVQSQDREDSAEIEIEEANLESRFGEAGSDGEISTETAIDIAIDAVSAG